MNGEIYARPIVNKRVCMERMTIEDLFKTLMGIQVKDVLNALASFKLYFKYFISSILFIF